MEKYAYHYPTLMKIITLKNEGKSVKDFFYKNGMYNIAIYGAGELGKYIYLELEGTGITVDSFIDRNYQKFPQGLYDIPVVGTISDKNIDAVVVTVLYESNSITDFLLQQGLPLTRIINLNDVVYGVDS
ncbi:hypothetical protein LJC32_04855 [Oscillospiraceae bacterium OttesenSCG-928-F05]|nr:hypothetical protein [Oscillospiraceae bacterium OttesenSCG-928-F05]